MIEIKAAICPLIGEAAGQELAARKEQILVYGRIKRIARPVPSSELCKNPYELVRGI
jgi:hypothetical protein